MKDHVTNLELSRKMRELGFPQESKFYWDSHAVEKTDGYDDYKFGITSDGEYSAYLASELGDWLPAYFHKGGVYYPMRIEKDIRLDAGKRVITWIISYSNVRGYNHFVKSIQEKTMTSAMAKMLIYLTENKLFDPTNP